MSGITASLITKNPLPFLVGLSTCFPTVLALQKSGGEFQVNTHTTGNQTTPAVSFKQWKFCGRLGRPKRRRWKLLWSLWTNIRCNSAKVGSEFQVNTYTTGDQYIPSVSTLSTGDFVVAWKDYSGEDGSGTGVFGQIFNATGSKVGNEFQVNTYTTGDQVVPSVSSLTNGNFVIAWWDTSGQDGNGNGVFGQIFNATAAKVGNEFQVNTYTTGNQADPSVSSLSTGNFVVTWEDDSGEDGKIWSLWPNIQSNCR